MGYARGKAQPYESLTPADYKFFPIWEMAIEAEGEPGQDETWRQPLIGAKNVEKTMVAVYVPFDVLETDLMGVALYATDSEPPLGIRDCPRDQLAEVTVWWNGRWVWIGGEEGPNLTWPLTVRVRPTIEGEAGVHFSIEKAGTIVGTRCAS